MSIWRPAAGSIDVLIHNVGERDRREHDDLVGLDDGRRAPDAAVADPEAVAPAAPRWTRLFN